MALRDQPYLPLYVQDFLTDEKLMECSASATGIYIRLLCIFHKSEEYGVILLKQKDKQTDNQIKNFALKLAKYLPYSTDEIMSGISELLIEGVLQNDGDKISQKRMIKDNEISIIRAEAGKKGGEKTQQFAKAKGEANSEYEDANANINDNSNSNINSNKEGISGKFDFKKALISLDIPEQIIIDWLKVRKAKRASNTETAFNAVKKQIELSGATPTDCIKKAVEKSWCGFEAEWYLNTNKQNNGISQRHFAEANKNSDKDWSRPTSVSPIQIERSTGGS